MICKQCDRGAFLRWVCQCGAWKDASSLSDDARLLAGILKENRNLTPAERAIVDRILEATKES